MNALPRSLLPLCLLAALSGCGWECNASTCASGCCSSDNTCIINGGSTSCGLAGQACESCQVCNLGVCGCTAGLERIGGSCRCTAKSCGTGCCDFTYNTGGSCVQQTSQTDYTCGANGASCGQCNYPATCKSGTCSSASASQCLGYFVSCSYSSECCSGRSCRWDSSYGDTVCQ